MSASISPIEHFQAHANAFFFLPFSCKIHLVCHCAMSFKCVNAAAKFGPALLHFVTNVTKRHGLDVQQFL